MTTFDTTYRRGFYEKSWRAETIVPLPFLIEGFTAQLKLSTYKASNGGLVSYADVQTTDNGFTTTRIFRDFHKLILRSDSRCTEKAVRTQHELVVAEAAHWEAAATDYHQELGDLP